MVVIILMAAGKERTRFITYTKTWIKLMEFKNTISRSENVQKARQW